MRASNPASSAAPGAQDVPGTDQQEWRWPSLAAPAWAWIAVPATLAAACVAAAVAMHAASARLRPSFTREAQWAYVASQRSGSHHAQHADVALASTSTKRHAKWNVARAQAAVKYKVMQTFTSPLWGKVAVLMALGIPFVAVGSHLYQRLTGSNWRDATYKSLSVIVDAPGVDITNEDNPRAGAVLNVLWFSGLLTFSVIFGIVIEDISAAMSNVRAGNWAVVENNHTVVLGWNRQILPVLRQISAAQLERGTSSFGNPVVVLADKDKEAMEEELAELEGGPLEFAVRSGNPTRVDDLDTVSAAEAGTVIVLVPDADSYARASSQQAATLAALRHCGGVAEQQVVVQAISGQQAAQYSAATDAYQELKRSVNPSMALVSSRERVGQLMAQCALQPTLVDVYSQLLHQDEDGPEFYVAEPGQCEGKTFGEARLLFHNAVVCGVVLGGHDRMQLNPPETLVLGPTDRLVLVASDASQTKPADAPYESTLDGRKLKRLHRSTYKPFDEVLVLSFNTHVDAVLTSLGTFAQRGSRATLVIDDACRKDARVGNLHVRVCAGDPASSAALDVAALRSTDSVLITGLEQLDPEDADAQVVSSVIQLQRRVTEINRAEPLRVVADVNSPETAGVLQQVSSLNVLPDGRPRVIVRTLCPDEIQSGLITQVAAEPALNSAFQELFSDSAGCEVYVKRPGYYGIPTGMALTWGDVRSLVRGRGEVAVGLVRDGKVDLSPPASEEWTVKYGDKVVVIAEEL